MAATLCLSGSSGRVERGVEAHVAERLGAVEDRALVERRRPPVLPD